MGTLGAVGIGVLAGLAVAMPVGPVGVLLLREGMVRGSRVAVGGACGIAAVDTAYAVLAVLVGVRVAEALTPHASTLRLVGAVLLAGVGLYGLLRVVGPWSWARGTARALSAATAASGTAGGWRTCGRFVALTAVNPLTALTFATVAVSAVAGLAGDDPRLLGAAFVAGVGAASLSWHLVVAAGAGVLGRRLGARGRSLTAVVGSVTVMVLALVLASG